MIQLYLAENRRLTNTIDQFDLETKECRDLFVAKTKDYGTAWRILRPSSLTDQIFIKAKRIRTIEEKGAQRVADDVHQEFVGIANYAVMTLIQLNFPSVENLNLPLEHAVRLYDQKVLTIRELLQEKNHDYGEAWRDMRISSFTDMILMKILRVKEIEQNSGKTTVSEGLEANFKDIFNYAIFALIKLRENQ